jgi:hypothetical protein
LSDYLSLFPSKSQNMPRLMLLASALLQQVTEQQSLVDSISAAFTLDHAVGKQLDIFGQSFGVPRPNGMTDAIYRDLLRMKMILWSWDGMNSSVVSLVSRLIPGAVQTDHDDLSVTITSPTTPPADYRELFPVPPGIKANVSE